MAARWAAEDRRARAERAQQQREAWNRLLELRILLQPLMGLANRLPRGEVGFSCSTLFPPCCQRLSMFRKKRPSKPCISRLLAPEVSLSLSLSLSLCLLPGPARVQQGQRRDVVPAEHPPHRPAVHSLRAPDPAFTAAQQPGRGEGERAARRGVPGGAEAAARDAGGARGGGRVGGGGGGL